MANYGAADSTIAALLRIRIGDGTIERRWNIPPAPEGHTLGDLAVGPKGDVFVTDSNEPVLYWLRPGADTLESIRSPLFRSLQGLAPTPDGLFLYVADYSHGILRVSLATKTVMRVADAHGSTSLGCDGLAWDRGAIVAVQNGVAPARVVRFALNSSGDRFTEAKVLDQNIGTLGEPQQQCLAFGLAQIERDAFLVARIHLPVGADALHAPLAQGVALAWLFDLDHFGAEIA